MACVLILAYAHRAGVAERHRHLPAEQDYGGSNPSTRSYYIIEGLHSCGVTLGMCVMRDRDGKWEDPGCFLKAHGQADCDGVMELKDVVLSPGSFDMISDDHHDIPKCKPSTIEKTWVCNKCGFVFYD